MYVVSSEDTEAPPQPHLSAGQSDDDDEDDDEEPEEEEEEEEHEEEEEEEEEEGGDDEDANDDEDGVHHPSVSLSSSSNLLITAVSNLSSLSHLREIGKEALCWRLSSAKPGNGVEQIRDGNIESYWQSDGTKQPHWIQVHFARRVAISHVCLYLDYALDESYTPKKIWVDHGMTNQDLQAAVYPENTEIEFQEPVGWCIVPLSSPPDPLDECCQADGENENAVESASSNNRQLVRTHMLRISVLSMHQNGRDTHIRLVELYGPRMMGDNKSLLPTTNQQQQQLQHHHLAGVRRGILSDNYPPHHNMAAEGSMMEEDNEDDDNDLGELAFSSFGTIR